MDTGDALTLLGLALAVLLFRLQVLVARRRDIGAAISVLNGVRRGMAGEGGWGEHYFPNRWTPDNAQQEANAHEKMILERRYGIILAVPKEPLAVLLASSGTGDLISEDTVRAASVGLWHLETFNQLVGQHTALLTQHFVEIVSESTPDERRRELALAVARQTVMLHRRGVGEPDEEGGWYRNLKDAIDADLRRLRHEREWHRLLGLSGAALALAVLASAGALTASIAADEPGRELPPPTTVTTTP